MSDFIALWPQSASAYSGRLDLLMWVFTALVVALSAPVFILIAYYAWKYRAGRKADRSDRVNRNTLMEISWALIPFILIVALFVWSTRMFFTVHQPPPDAMEINVVAKQWMWKFEHAGGQREIDELHVPVGEPVRLSMASQDVIHSLYIPALRLKQDVVPGRYTSLWFEADKPGIYALACAEFCGADHSEMTGRFIVMEKPAFAAWLEQAGTDASLAAEGEKLFRDNGCSGCHGPAATVKAPDLEGLYGRPVPLADGRTVTADDQYIRDSILLPQSEIAAGYPEIMPTYKNVLSEDEVMKLVAYIKSLATPEDTP
ncbi:cytochrome c oxidase subunit II [Martelella mediterranea]|uniref:cytochrome-c oxidase n=1 Tax=Martelella mediterranea DSM 17316 TaxID=1122214 RepID=A0A1U9Z7R7_9HYPH|nr:cytochrome c oxidase subunit II [Martelella mediterranea]AQZ53731.1 Cytochrome c oxidase subunit 2 precursor [Martelella mediterranea DSM 17316]